MACRSLMFENIQYKYAQNNLKGVKSSLRRSDCYYLEKLYLYRRILSVYEKCKDAEVHLLYLTFLLNISETDLTVMEVGIN